MYVPERYLIDTNIFLRFLVRENDRVWRASKTLLAKVEDGTLPMVTSPIVLAEVQWVLGTTYRQPKQVIIEALRGIQCLRHLSFDHQPNNALALALYEQHSIKFVDALLASDARIHDGRWGIVSYDKDFDKIEGVIRKEPQEVLKKLL